MITSVDPATPRSAPCPICGKRATLEHRPFCSARCRNVDLNRWFKGSYAVETDEGAEDGSDEAG
jgi:uncharacterized protein